MSQSSGWSSAGSFSLRISGPGKIKNIFVKIVFDFANKKEM